MAIFFRKPNVKALLVEKNEKGLIAALGYNDDPNLQAEAASALGDLASKKAVGAIIKTVTRSEHKQTQLNCIRALGQIKDEKAVDPLISLITPNTIDLHEFSLRSKDWNKLYLIVCALGQISDPKALDPLMGLFKKANNLNFVGIIAESLSKLNSAVWLEYLLSEIKISVEEPVFNSSKTLKIIIGLAATGSSNGIELIIQGFKNTERETIRFGTYGNEPTLLTQEVKLFQKMVEDNIKNLDETVLRKIEIMPNINHRYVIPEHNIPGDDGWGHRENQDEYISPQHHDEEIDCSNMRELAKKELQRRKQLL